MSRAAVCIGCGQAIGPLPRLNRLPDGKPCPTCQDRLLETLPPVLPAPLAELSFEDWSDEGGDEPPDDYLRGA